MKEERKTGRVWRILLTVISLAVVAMATVLACQAVRFFWGMAHPSAEELLNRARSEAGNGHFQEALHLAGEARLARHNDICAAHIEELILAIRAWQDTAIAWEAIQRHMENGKWVWAQQGFTKVSKWDWNTDTAIEHKRRAESVERLLNAYLDMRQTLGNAYSRAEQLAEGRANWEKALADAECEPAMQASVWPMSFEAEFGSGESIQIVAKNTAYTNVWLPLRDAGGAVAAEIADGIAAEQEIRAALAGLAGADILSSPAQACREKIRALHEADLRHKAEQVTEQQSNGYRILRFCPLAENEYHRVWGALDDLAEAEQTVVSNLETVAAMEPGWEQRLQPRLAFATHTDEPLIEEYRKTLENANAALCGSLRNIHLSAFRQMGMDDPSGTPAAIARLTRPGTVQAAMRFIDWSEPPARWGIRETPIPGCAYDEILGCYYTYEFLTGGEEEAKDSLEMSLGDFESKWSFCPVARQARDNYRKLMWFVVFVNADPQLKAMATRPDPLPQKRPNRLKQYYDRARDLLRERDNWLTENVEPFCKGRDRDGVLARVLYLVVSPAWDGTMYEEARSIRMTLLRECFSLALEEVGAEEYLSKCVPDKLYFDEWREHAVGQTGLGDER